MGVTSGHRPRAGHPGARLAVLILMTEYHLCLARFLRFYGGLGSEINVLDFDETNIFIALS